MTIKQLKIISFTLITLLLSACKQDSVNQINLSGEWNVALDPKGEGQDNEWFKAPFQSETYITLPGTLDEAGIGKKITKEAKLDKETLYQLTRNYSYIGAAWYQKSITIPTDWENHSVYLEMERIIWKSQVWIDGNYKGMDNSLISAHKINLGILAPGNHLITICIDNRQQFDIFDNDRDRDLAHSYTETTQIKWNGILGNFRLIKNADFSIQNLEVHTDVDKKTVNIMALGTGKSDTKITLHILDDKGQIFKTQSLAAKPHMNFHFEGDFQLWDEFNTSIYTAQAFNEKGELLQSTTFGLRKIESIANNMLINGKRVFLRGTLECCIFPLTGHPPLNEEGWEKVFGTAKKYGLNHMRFHSWCPPEAAFRVADRMGFYLQVEMPNWSLKYGDDMNMVAWMESEGLRMLRDYGNHPSFCMMALGNELQGNYELLSNFVRKLQANDDRHLYTTTAFTFQKPYSKEPNSVDEYWITQWTKDGWVRGQGVFDTEVPSFNKDYRPSIEFLDIPLITHEIGQYSVYPNLKEIEKYTGVLSPHNFEAIKNDLKLKGRLNKADDYLKASGQLAKILYKEEIERALKTPGISGFQLLDLHDFPGQGTALVGLLDAFWDSKGIISGDKFRQFCSEFVPLLKFEKAVYTQDETFTAKAEVCNYWKDLNTSTFEWNIKQGENILTQGTLAGGNIKQGAYAEIGHITYPLNKITSATKLDITLSLKGTSYKNEWSIWVYPNDQKVTKKDLIITSDWETAHKALALGQKVLLSPKLKEIKGITGKFVQVFWSPVHFPNQPGTMGILCNPSHPALKEFPTEFHTNWQWWDLCKQSITLDMKDLETDHIVTVVDNFFKNRNLSNLYEAKVSNGSLLFSSIDLHSDLANRPVASNLLISLTDYMNSDAFAPKKPLQFSDIESYFRKNINTKNKKMGTLYDEDGF